MAQLNKVFLIGNLTADPELRYTPNGSAVSDLRLAINRSWTNKEGASNQDTVYIDVTVWERQAENCVKFLKKGRSVHVEGYLKMDSWESNGEKRSKIKVVAETVQFLDRGGDGAREGGGDPDAATYGPPPSRMSGGGGGGGGARGGRDSGPGAGAGRGGYGYGPKGSPTPPRPDDDEENDVPF